MALAHLFRSLDPKPYAVIGIDSDFFIMEGVHRYIPLNHFDTGEGPLGNITARAFTRELVAATLDIPEEHLADLAALCGNDTTDAFLDKHPVLATLGLKVRLPARALLAPLRDKTISTPPPRLACLFRITPPLPPLPPPLPPHLPRNAWSCA